MRLEDQVTSREVSLRFLATGARLKSAFFHHRRSSAAWIIIPADKRMHPWRTGVAGDDVPAWTVGELMDILPVGNAIEKREGPFWDVDDTDPTTSMPFVDANPANALCHRITWLIENKFMTEGIHG